MFYLGQAGYVGSRVGYTKMGPDHQSLINQKQFYYRKQNPGNKKIIINLHEAQQAYQLAETTARNEFCSVVTKASF